MLLSFPVCDLPLYFLKTLKETAPGLFMCCWGLNYDSHLGHSSLNINVTSSKRSSHLPPIQDILYHIAQLYILQSESTWIVSLLVYCLHHITRRLNLMKSRTMNGLSTGISLDTHNVNLAHREGTQTILLAIRYTNGQGNGWMNGQMHRQMKWNLRFESWRMNWRGTVENKRRDCQTEGITWENQGTWKFVHGIAN